MNMYIFEMKAQIKSFLIWSIAILSILIAFMQGVYPVFHDALEDVLKLLEGFPEGFLDAFGMKFSSFISYGGFYSFTFGYLSLMGAIMAVSLTLSIFAREKRAKCSDFILTKPLSRRKIFIMKLLSVISILTAMNVIFIVTALICYPGDEQTQTTLGRYIVALIALYLTQLIFVSIALLYATYAKKIRSISGIATAVGFSAFILSALSNLIDDKAMRFLAPLRYFDPEPVFLKGAFDVPYVIIAIVLIVFGILLSYIKFDRSDVHAV